MLFCNLRGILKILNYMKKAFRRLYDSIIPHTGNQGHPHVIHPLSLVIVGVIGIAMIVGVFSLTGDGNRSHLRADVYASLLVDLTNQDRSENKLALLTKSDLLTRAAQLKADDMAAKGYFAHVSPEGYNSWHWFNRAGYSFVYAGENLAVDFTESRDVADAWMKSPTHRANIVNPNFTQIGIATAEGVYQGKPTTFVVQMFGKPSVVPVAVVDTVSRPKTTPPRPVTVVLGETTVIAQNTQENSTFVAVKNEAAESVPIAETIPESVGNQTPWYQKLLIELSKPIGIILIIIGALLIIGFVLSFIYHKTVTERIAAAVLIAFLVVFSGYVYLSIAHDMSAVLGLEQMSSSYLM